MFFGGLSLIVISCKYLRDHLSKGSGWIKYLCLSVGQLRSRYVLQHSALRGSLFRQVYKRMHYNPMLGTK